MNTTCTHCQEPLEADGYCADGCALYVGSLQPVTLSTLAHEASTSALY